MKIPRLGGGSFRLLFTLGSTVAFATPSVLAGGVVTQPTEAALKAAVAGGGTVTFSFDGTISLTSPVIIDSDTVIDSTGHKVQIYGRGSCRLAAVYTGVSATFRGLQMYAGADRPAGGATQAPDALGGGIVNQGGNVTVEDCFFFGNSAVGYTPSSTDTGPNLQPSGAYGGAIYSQGGSLHLIHSVFVQSRATGGSAGQLVQDGKSGYGGAVAMNGGTLSIDSSTFLSNEATGGGTSDNVSAGGSGVGGALFLSGTTVQINTSAFESNFASAANNKVKGQPVSGGAIWSNGELHLTDSLVLSNRCVGVHASAFGGGICSFGSVELNRSSVSHNLAQGSISAVNDSGIYLNAYSAYGGGLYQSGFLTLLNSTFLDNRAQGGIAPVLLTISAANASGSGLGGGIYFENGTASIAFTTFAMNKALAGAVSFVTQPMGAAFGDDIFNNSALVGARDSIFGSYVSGSVYGPLADIGYNIEVDNSAGFTQSTSLNYTDPKFGIPTAAYIPLAAGSPAIDSADTSDFPYVDQILTSRVTGHPAPAPVSGFLTPQELISLEASRGIESYLWINTSPHPDRGAIEYVQ